MSTQTMVFGSNSRRSNQWRLYRIRTANSVYELEVETPGVGRRCVVLTCVEPANRAGENFEDSSPQAGAESLYALSPMEWMGRCLVVGTARTSEVQAVDFLASNAERRSLSRTRTFPLQPPQRAPEPPPSWAPFPAGHVEMAEAAASLLKNVCHRRDLGAALETEQHLQQRLRLAFAECQLMLEALVRKS